jgi:serine protease Do
MKYSSKYIIFSFAFLLITTCTNTPVADSDAISAQSEKKQFYVYGESFYSSIVDIAVYDKSEDLLWSGTGTYINSDGYIVTNQHVSVGGSFYDIYPYSMFDLNTGKFIDPTTGNVVEPLEAKLIASSQCNDISLLKVDSDIEVNYLEWYGKDFSPGLEVYTLGYPGIAGGNIAVTTGVVSFINSDGDTDWTAPGRNTFAHTAPIYGGNSGGPVVSSEGKIVGINNMSVPGDKVGNFELSSAINNDFVKNLIENYLIKGIDYQDLGMESRATDMWYFLDENDSREFTVHFIEVLQPNGIAYNSGLKVNDLLIEVNNQRIGEFELSTQLCDVLKEWEESENNSIDYLAYSCSNQMFYKGTFNKDKSQSTVNNGIGNKFSNDFKNYDFDNVCDSFLDFYYGS